MADAERWTEYLRLSALRPDPRNPKAHSIEQLRESLGEFGYIEQITLDERTGLLVAGHGRRELLLDDFAASRPAPEGIEVDADGEWIVPVSRGWSSRDETEAYAYLIASNEVGPRGGWDRELLAGGLEHLVTLERQLVGTGIPVEDASDLRALLNALAGSEPERNTVGHGSQVVLRFKVPPELRDRYRALVGDDDDGFARVLGMAESARP